MRKKYDLRWRKQDSYEKNKTAMEQSSTDKKRKFENNEEISSMSTSSAFKAMEEVIINPGY
jgi:hypothetical protein